MVMPALTRRQQTLTARQMASVKPSIETEDTMFQPLWAVGEDYEKPQKEMDFPLAPMSKAPSRKESMNNLRINTYPSSDLHERYMSSEEEPSPSPDSDTDSNEEELMHKIPAASSSNTADLADLDEFKAEIAIAVPIMAVGRPKLINVTDLAPMQKRKRTLKPMRSRSAFNNTTSRIAAVTEEIDPSTNREVTKITTSEGRISKRDESLPMLAPSSWLPDDVTLVPEEDEDEHYFPDLELRNPPTYNDYDPYSLDPPRLSPRNSVSSPKKPGSVSRARNNSNSVPPITMHNGWKGITKSLSIAKKQTLHRVDHQITKKPKMVARAANERKDSFLLPSFPLIDKKSE